MYLIHHSAAISAQNIKRQVFCRRISRDRTVTTRSVFSREFLAIFLLFLRIHTVHYIRYNMVHYIAYNTYRTLHTVQYGTLHSVQYIPYITYGTIW
jgi:hypothetical protein